CNYANGDMVGHSGVLAAAIQAVEAVDRCLGRGGPAVREGRGLLVVTPGHGHCGQMGDYAAGEPPPHHPRHPGPLIRAAPDGSPLRQAHLRSGGRLCDVTPTILDVMRLPLAPEMTCRTLISS